MRSAILLHSLGVGAAVLAFSLLASLVQGLAVAPPRICGEVPFGIHWTVCSVRERVNLREQEKQLLVAPRQSQAQMGS